MLQRAWRASRRLWAWGPTLGQRAAAPAAVLPGSHWPPQRYIGSCARHP